jgi:purine-binding chemotaxis protein CheW
MDEYRDRHQQVHEEMPRGEPMDAKKKMSHILQLVSFVLEKEIFAVDVLRVQGVERILEITSIPGMPDFVEGVINLREAIIPVVDLRKRFHLRAAEYDKETRIMLVELSSGIVVGMIVDQVNEVFQTEPDKVGAVPAVGGIGGGLHKNYIRGLVKKDERLIIILDVEKIFSEEEAEAMHHA